MSEDLVPIGDISPARRAAAVAALVSPKMQGALDAMLSYVKAQVGWEVGRWWRVVGPDGELWCETSDEQECREAMRPGDTLQRMWRREETEWRDADA